MTTQKDSDSRMEENLPNSNECRQTEVMNETCFPDVDFSFVGKMPVISDEGEPFFPSSSSFPSVSVSPQPAEEEESNRDISADSQT